MAELCRAGVVWRCTPEVPLVTEVRLFWEAALLRAVVLLLLRSCEVLADVRVVTGVLLLRVVPEVLTLRRSVAVAVVLFLLLFSDCRSVAEERPEALFEVTGVEVLLEVEALFFSTWSSLLYVIALLVLRSVLLL